MECGQRSSISGRVFSLLSDMEALLLPTMCPVKEVPENCVDKGCVSEVCFCCVLEYTHEVVLAIVVAVCDVCVDGEVEDVVLSLCVVVVSLSQLKSLKSRFSQSVKKQSIQL